MKKWEVWWASFPYEESRVEKVRPVIILKFRGSEISVAKLTTHEKRYYDLSDVRIKDWKEAGLKRPSVSRISKNTSLEKEKFIERMGKLSVRDRRKVQSVYKRYLQQKEREETPENPENRKFLDEQLKELHSSSPEKENQDKDRPEKEKEPEKER